MTGNNILFTVFFFACIWVLAKVVNHYQDRWQALRDEEQVIAETSQFISKWSRYVKGEDTDERLAAVDSEVDQMTAAARQQEEAAQAEDDAVPDEVFIAAAAERIKTDAAYNGKVDPPEPLTRKELDKRMFARVEQEKGLRGVLPLNEDGIVYDQNQLRGGSRSRDRVHGESS